METQIRIALIRQRYTPFGGAERFVENALNTLQKQSDIELTLITRIWNGSDNPNTKKIICNPFYIGRLWRDWSFARCACNAIKKNKFDLVQSHERIPCGDIFRAGDGVHKEWLIQRKKITPLWKQWLIKLSPYHLYLLNQERNVFEAEERKVIIAISNMVKKDILKHYIPKAIIHTILNSVDLNRYHPKHRCKFRPEIRTSLGLTNNEKILLFVGSGFHRKGLSIIINIISSLPKSIHLVVVGKDKHMSHYKQVSEQQQIENRVHFVGPVINPIPYYASSDLFVFPTVYEPFSNAVLEALACGLPVIISDTCGAKDIITPGINGNVISIDNITAWKNTIVKYIQVSNIHNMRHSARKTAETLAEDILADRLIETYKTTLKLIQNEK